MAKSRYDNLSGADLKPINMPKVVISKRDTDKFMTYDSNKRRLDTMSYETYGDDGYGWLILVSNPEYFMEFDIPQGTAIRIPFPIKDVLKEFTDKVIRNKNK